jgi:peptidoglycan DL-endopeptidase CwlO
VVAVVAVALGVPALASASPTDPKPSIASVKQQLTQLSEKNAQLVEKFDQAQVAVKNHQVAAREAKAFSNHEAALYASAHWKFREVIQAQYETGDAYGAAGALLDSTSGVNYLDRLDMMGMVSTRNADIVDEVSAAHAAAIKAAQQAHTALAQARQDRNALATQRTAVAAQITHYKTLLAQLTAAQRAAWEREQQQEASAQQVAHLQQAADNPTTTTTGNQSNGTKHASHSADGGGAPLAAGAPAPTAAAATAVRFALAQVGKPYVWGASGPGSYDCSGLTMASYAAAGISIPHSSAEQYNFGHHVSESDLEPGDLLFFYNPIGHVTIYIGHGEMVSAPETGEDVMVVSLHGYSAPLVGATRLT